jgi:hypothetical protein
VDREKVIKGLECHADRTNMSCNIAKCPYYELDFCGVRLSQDALDLLKEQEHKDKMFHALEEDWKRLKALMKEQEPVKPIPPTDESEMWRCGNCHHQIFRCTHQRFCERCGREVKWE